MWLLERRRDVLRIGRQCAEYWVSTADGLELHARLVLGAEPGAVGMLEAELRGWLQALGGEASRANRVDVVLESAWLPVMLIEVGRQAWSRGQVERLARHRIAQLHLPPGVPADDWGLRLDHRPGDAQAIVYGLAPSTRQAVLDAMTASGRRAASLQPAWAWARQRLARRGPGLRTGWWGWAEQDRALVGRFERGRITALNAGAPLPGDDGEQARLFAVEAARCGLREGGAALMTRWHDLVATRVKSPDSTASSALEATA